MSDTDEIINQLNIAISALEKIRERLVKPTGVEAKEALDREIDETFRKGTKRVMKVGPTIKVNTTKRKPRT